MRDLFQLRFEHTEDVGSLLTIADLFELNCTSFEL